MHLYRSSWGVTIDSAGRAGPASPGRRNEGTHGERREHGLAQRSGEAESAVARGPFRGSPAPGGENTDGSRSAPRSRAQSLAHRRGEQGGVARSAGHGEQLPGRTDEGPPG